MRLTHLHFLLPKVSQPFKSPVLNEDPIITGIKVSNRTLSPGGTFTLLCLIYLTGGSLQTYLFVNFFFSCVSNLFDGWIIRNLSVCSLVFTLLCLFYLMGGSLETYTFTHWFSL